MIFYKALNFNWCHFTKQTLKAVMTLLELIKMTFNCLLCVIYKEIFIYNVYFLISKVCLVTFC